MLRVVTQYLYFLLFVDRSLSNCSHVFIAAYQQHSTWIISTQLSPAPCAHLQWGTWELGLWQQGNVVSTPFFCRAYHPHSAWALHSPPFSLGIQTVFFIFTHILATIMSSKSHVGYSATTEFITKLLLHALWCFVQVLWVIVWTMLALQ